MDQIYLQKCGIAMGKRFAVALANIYLIDFDRSVKLGYEGTQPISLYRFLDDIFFIWPGTMELLIKFQDHINKLIPGIKVTFHNSQQSVNFLDTTVYTYHGLNGCQLATRVYFKDTDSHLLLHTQSFHPKHTCRGLIRSQLLRFARICTSRVDLHIVCNILFKAIQRRGYTQRFLRRIKGEVIPDHSTKSATSHTIERDGPGSDSEDFLGILPIVIQYNPKIIALTKQWREAILKYSFFRRYKIVIAYTNNPNIRRRIIHTKINRLPEDDVDVVLTPYEIE